MLFGVVSVVSRGMGVLDGVSVPQGKGGVTTVAITRQKYMVLQSSDIDTTVIVINPYFVNL